MNLARLSTAVPGTSPLHEERLDRVYRQIRQSGARRVLDLGCGSGALLVRLLNDPYFNQIVGLESSGVGLAVARNMFSDSLASGRLTLVAGSYAEPHAALVGFEMAAMVETIEHVKPNDLSRVEQAVFGQMRPHRLIMTTPNREYNPLLGLAPGEFREPDHKFEWDRQKFMQWSRGVAGRNGYAVRFAGIGEADAELGAPTQTATFSLLGR
ncbi:methyltransferase domain-containing protein [Saccharospirillum impatiens]|uniref:methyltransferase domain-containing protein n=1 Tax=Saccharospirillum impatiens TaxID=169438 RepID=UPI001FDF6D94|nr:methyltransferase domain-containing protein [Saccharospirillum impatiens]